jgi:RHS repeat-associated protein
VYDQNYWIDQINTVPSAWGMDYSTDAVGNITQLAQTANGATRTQAIVYDNLNRLKEVREASALIEGYSYDATGNRLSRQPGTQASEAYTYGAASHRLGSVAGTARAYDAAGNTGSIASTPAIELIHDQRNRLTEYRSGGTTLASYQYSGRGERVAKTQGAATQRFVYDEAGRLIYETGSGSPRTYLWSDDAPIAIIDGTALTGYIVPDNLGTPRAITDSAGTAIWRWDQVAGSTTTGGSAVFGQGAANTDPDGNGTHVTFNPRFPGQYLDAESGLHYNYFRDYEPGTGRYVQSDPIGLAGSIATYEYAAQDPVNSSDEHGLQSQLGKGIGPLYPRTCWQEGLYECCITLSGRSCRKNVPQPSDDPMCSLKCNLLLGLVCAPPAAASGASGPGAAGVYLGCRAIVAMACSWVCYPDSCGAVP